MWEDIFAVQLPLADVETLRLGSIALTKRWEPGKVWKAFLCERFEMLYVFSLVFSISLQI